jgi:hypothetical protein
MADSVALASFRRALVAAYGLGLQQIATPCRLPSKDQTHALRLLASIARRHPSWEPGGTFEALAADPIAADLWAAGVIATAGEVA